MNRQNAWKHTALPPLQLPNTGQEHTEFNVGDQKHRHAGYLCQGAGPWTLAQLADLRISIAVCCTARLPIEAERGSQLKLLPIKPAIKNSNSWHTTNPFLQEVFWITRDTCELWLSPCCSSITTTTVHYFLTELRKQG